MDLDLCHWLDEFGLGFKHNSTPIEIDFTIAKHIKIKEIPCSFPCILSSHFMAKY